jgi:hypothetical protein
MSPKQTIDLMYVGRGIHEELVAYVADQQGYFEDEGVHVAVRNGIGWETERLRGGAIIGLGKSLVSRLTEGVQWTALAVNTHRPLFWFLEQETYVHFETAVAWSADHLTIQGRGQADGGITSGEMVSIYTARSFCHEARYRIPSQDKSWPAFWFYGSTSASDKSEIDVEQPITPNQGVTSVSMYNHPSTADVVIVDPLFTTPYMTWTNPAFDGSAAPHVYTACYDDAASTITRYIDGKEIYSGTFKWNASLGGTGFGPDATTIFNLAVGGDWPGNLTDPGAYSADLDLSYIDYYGP